MRVLHQRLRNRLIECFELFAQGDEGVREAGFAEYFCAFYDWVGHGDERHSFDLVTFAAEERRAFDKMFVLLEEVCDNTPNLMSEDEFVATGWPIRIAEKATPILKLFLERGRFSETVEQDEPATEV